MIIQTVPASEELLRKIVPMVRVESAREITRFGMNVEDILRKAIYRADECWVGIVDGEIVCMWGVELTTMLSDEVYVWLITTDMVSKHHFVFLRNSQRFVEYLMQRYRRIYGSVLTDFDKSITWLRWLGFTVQRANGLPVRAFEKVRDNG